MSKNPHPKVEIYDDVFKLKVFKSIIPFVNTFDYAMNICENSCPYFTSNCSGQPFLNEIFRGTVPFERLQTDDIEHCVVELHSLGSFPPITKKNQYQKVLIHCLNPEWKDTWGGQMMFYDETGKIVCSVAYKPNRAVLFHADLAYRCNTTNVKGPKFMYTLKTTFWKPRVNKKFARLAK